MITIITCKFCGSQIPDHASFCGSCGQTLDDDINDSTSDLSQEEAETPEPLPVARALDSEAAALQSASVAPILSDSPPDAIAVPNDFSHEAPAALSDPFPAADVALSDSSYEAPFAPSDPFSDPAATLNDSSYEAPLAPSDSFPDPAATLNDSSYEAPAALNDSFPDADVTVSASPLDYIVATPTTHLTEGHVPSPYETVLDLNSAIEDAEQWNAAPSDLAIPYFGGGQQVMENMPQEIPPFDAVPTLQLTPQPESVPFTPFDPTSYPGMDAESEALVPGSIPSTFPMTPLPQTYPSPGQSGSPAPAWSRFYRKPKFATTRGYITWLSLLAVSLILVISIPAIGSMVFSPSLSLNGGQSVSQGTSVTLNGNGFVPGTSVTLTRDGSIPVYYSPQASSGRSNVVSAGANGAFHVTIAIGQDWQVGQHVIQASEAFLARSAALSFQVRLFGQAPVAMDTPTPTPSPTPTAAPFTNFTGVSPTSVTLGPVGEGSNVSASAPVTLFTEGVNLLTWTASSSASWLQLSATSGQIQTPNSQQVTINAVSNGLKAGNYTATVNFASDQTGKTVSLNVTFVIRPGCVKGGLTSMNFVGIAGTVDPKPQALAVTNCALSGVWAATPSANWLRVTPGNGAFNAGATQTVSVTASNLNAKLGPGTYQGNILLTDGSGQFTVSVTLTVGSPALLGVAQASINANASCQFVQGAVAGTGTWLCGDTLTNSSAQFPLSWSASRGARPAGGVIGPGQSAAVTIVITTASCGRGMTVVFRGPGNAVAVNVNCTPPAAPPPTPIPAPNPGPVGSVGDPPASSSTVS